MEQSAFSLWLGHKPARRERRRRQRFAGRHRSGFMKYVPSLELLERRIVPSWTPIGTVTIPANLGTATFADPLTPANRFYRLIYP